MDISIPYLRLWGHAELACFFGKAEKVLSVI